MPGQPTSQPSARSVDLRGKRLLPTLIDSSEPERIWASFPVSTNVEEGFRDVTYGQLVRAVDYLAHWIVENIGSSDKFQAVAYFGGSDLRYFLVPLAMMKTGHVMVSMSHRNVRQGHITLMEQTKCTTIFCAKGIDIGDLASEPGFKAFEVPDLEALLSVKDVKPFPYNKTFEQAERDPILIVYSSGTTGLPKQLIYTHAHYAVVDAHSIPSSYAGRENVYAPMARCQRHYSAMPVAHASSFMRFLRCILLGVTLVVDAGRYVTRDAASVLYLKQVLRHGRIDAVHFLPDTLSALAADAEGLQALSRLHFIGWGGAPLPKAVGDLLATTCTNAFLHNSHGSSDGGAFVSYCTDSVDWEWQAYCPIYNGIEWVEHGDNLYEMVVQRKPELEMYQGCFKSHPQLSSWTTKDLYKRHPTKEGLWKHECRVDDLVIMPNGGKFNPHSLQKSLEALPAVRTALMVGGDRPAASLLLELAEGAGASDSLAREKLLQEQIWPLIVRSNAQSVAHGRVMRGLVYIAPAEMPFPRSDKGSVRRGALLENVTPALDGMYAALAAKGGVGDYGL